MTNKKNVAIERKAIPLEVRAVNEDGSFTGYGSVFGVVDSYGDIVEEGAFVRTLGQRTKKIKFLWQHSSNSPIGVFTELYEDEYGLCVKGQFALTTQLGREAYELLKMGALDGLSIGYSTVIEGFDEGRGVRLIKEVKLYEISLVTFPANEAATVTSVKSAFEDLSNDERIQVLAYIQELKTKSLDDSNDPPIDASTAIEKHSEEQQPDETKADDPHADAELKHSLEQLLGAFMR